MSWQSHSINLFSRLDTIFSMNILLEPVSFMVVAIISGAIAGSFLSMVVHRLPLIMRQQWKRECREFLELEGKEASGASEISLSAPRSHCPLCNHQLRLVDNIPVIGFLLNRGHCNHCNHPIGWRYLTLELLGITVAITATLHFGPSSSAVASMWFGWILLALLFIDLEHRLLPDQLTYILLWSGLIINQWGLFTTPSGALFGAAAGYLVLWSIFHLYKMVTGREGMGGGDLKLLAALGAWCGWTLLPQILLVASLCGLLVTVPWILLKKESSYPLLLTAIPFGPFLAVAGWIALLWPTLLDIMLWGR